MSVLDKPAMLQMPVPFGIPAISNALLGELVQKIKPVVQKGDSLFYIVDVDPRNIAFTWEPTFRGLATGLTPVTTIYTLHEYGAPAFFKPSIAEVLAQIPAGYIDSVTAFETVPNRDTIDSWSQSDRDAMNWGYHIASTTLYKPE